jgi:glutamine synthetase
MAAVGVDIVTANAEYGPGQMEINFRPAWGVGAADHAFTFKNGVKEIHCGTG